MSYDDAKATEPDLDAGVERCDWCGGDAATCGCDPELDTVCSECGRSDGHDAPMGTCARGHRVKKDAA
jgi:hypothetical protein